MQSVGTFVNSHVNFNAHPEGTLQNDFYFASEGVTLSQAGWGIVQTGGGSESGSDAEPLSPGEGPLGTATYVVNDGPYQMTVSFDEPVVAVGFMVADYFNAVGDNTNTIEAFSGPDGTGTSLGQFQAVALNFETNSLYFMGLADVANTIGSVVLSGPQLHGDSVYLDKILFARIGDVPFLEADFDEDRDVDGDDLALWKGGFGNVTGAAHTEGDANGDGEVDGSDFLIWQQQAGPPALVVSANVPVPEPATILLFILAAAGIRRKGGRMRQRLVRS